MKAISVTKEVQEEMRVAGMASRQVAVWTEARMPTMDNISPRMARIGSRGTKEILFFVYKT